MYNFFPSPAAMSLKSCVTLDPETVMIDGLENIQPGQSKDFVEFTNLLQISNAPALVIPLDC